MSLLTGWAGCACRSRRRRIDERGFFLVEVLALSFLVLGCAASALVYRTLARSRVEAAAEITAAYLAQEQIARIEAQPASYLRTHGEIPWLGGGASPVEKNGISFTLSSSVSPRADTESLAETEVRVRWETGGRSREAVYRKFVAYHD